MKKRKRFLAVTFAFFDHSSIHLLVMITFDPILAVIGKIKNSEIMKSKMVVESDTIFK